MTYTILSIIMDVIILRWDIPCADWMMDNLPYEPRSLVKLDRWSDGDVCTVIYRAYMPAEKAAGNS